MGRVFSLSTLKITLIYLVIGTVWILLSDKIVLNISEDKFQLKQLQNFKGLIYVFLTSGVLFMLIHRFKKEIEDSNNKAIVNIRRFKQLFEYSTVGILIIDNNLKILECNPASQKILQSSSDAILECSLLDFVQNDDDKQLLLENSSIGNRIEMITFKRPDGSSVHLELMCFPLNDMETGFRKGVILHDISNSVIIEKDLKYSLKEKEILLSEVHHRVKNNLAIISSLLMVQISGNEKPNAEILETTIQRIKSIALIHELLYQAHTYASLEIGFYIKKLTTSVIETHKLKSIKITPVFNMTEKIHLGINKAIPAGLIINELLLNVIKHAFLKDKTDGIIEITLKKVKNCCEITIKDNGIGLPADFSFAESKTLGMTLVFGLAEQIDADVRFRSENGTEVIIAIPYAKNAA
jgi:PAS domain S-box-containing protein